MKRKIRLFNKSIHRGKMTQEANAFIITYPFVGYNMHKWLESFAYKTNLSWWIFALAGLLALRIALLTVSWQSR